MRQEDKGSTSSTMGLFVFLSFDFLLPFRSLPPSLSSFEDMTYDLTVFSMEHICMELALLEVFIKPSPNFLARGYQLP